MQILSAQAFIAEVFLDAFIVSVLYRRLRIATERGWLGTAIRKTWLLALSTAALLSVAGWCLEAITPDAHSIGPALRDCCTMRGKNRGRLDQSHFYNHCSVPPAPGL